MFSRFIRAIANISTSFLFFIAEYYIVWIYMHLFIHLSADWHWRFHFFAIINNAMNILVQVFVLTYVFISRGYIHRSGIRGHTVSLSRNYQTFTALASTARAPTSPLCQHWFLSTFLIIALLVDVKWHLIVASSAFPQWPMTLNIFPCVHCAPYFLKTQFINFP